MAITALKSHAREDTANALGRYSWASSKNAKLIMIVAQVHTGGSSAIDSGDFSGSSCW